jgi:HTH-type transcriptional regulator / antitoxin HigA
VATLKNIGLAPDWKAVAGAFEVLERELRGLGLAFSDANAQRMAERVDLLVTVTNDDAAPASLFRLLDELSEWLTAYELANTPVPVADPVDLLKHLMDTNGLRQSDLAEIFGGQSIVSAVLNRRRQINGRQALALGQRFKLSPAAFLGGVQDSLQLESAVSGPIPVKASERVSSGRLFELYGVEWQTSTHTLGCGVLQ